MLAGVKCFPSLLGLCGNRPIDAFHFMNRYSTVSERDNLRRDIFFKYFGFFFYTSISRNLSDSYIL